MPHTYTDLLYHIVFSTKERFPFITKELQSNLYKYIGGTVRGLGGSMVEIGGIADHVHLLVRLKPTMAISNTLRDLKTNSSVWAKEKTNGYFEWQDGYGAFTVSKSQIEVVKHYIQNQEKHHRTMNFEAEFKALLKRSGIDFDEKYLWR